jgi:hypothetical protein
MFREKAPRGKNFACVNHVCQAVNSDVATHDCFGGGYQFVDEERVQVPKTPGVCNPTIMDYMVDTLNHAPFHTQAGIGCSGAGVRAQDGRCVCHPSRTGEECEVPVCSRKNEACVQDRDCCNACDCAPDQLDCCPHFDPFSPPAVCQAGRCVNDDSPRTQSCKDEQGVCVAACYGPADAWLVRVSRRVDTLDNEVGNQ